jgi:hypothetical protein
MFPSHIGLGDRAPCGSIRRSEFNFESNIQLNPPPPMFKTMQSEQEDNRITRRRENRQLIQRQAKQGGMKEVASTIYMAEKNEYCTCIGI